MVVAYMYRVAPPSTMLGEIPAWALGIERFCDPPNLGLQCMNGKGRPLVKGKGAPLVKGNEFGTPLVIGSPKGQGQKK